MSFPQTSHSISLVFPLKFSSTLQLSSKPQVKMSIGLEEYINMERSPCPGGGSDPPINIRVIGYPGGTLTSVKILSVFLVNILLKITLPHAFADGRLGVTLNTSRRSLVFFFGD